MRPTPWLILSTQSRAEFQNTNAASHMWRFFRDRRHWSFVTWYATTSNHSLFLVRPFELKIVTSRIDMEAWLRALLLGD